MSLVIKKKLARAVSELAIYNGIVHKTPKIINGDDMMTFIDVARKKWPNIECHDVTSFEFIHSISESYAFYSSPTDWITLAEIYPILPVSMNGNDVLVKKATSREYYDNIENCKNFLENRGIKFENSYAIKTIGADCSKLEFNGSEISGDVAFLTFIVIVTIFEDRITYKIFDLDNSMIPNPLDGYDYLTHADDTDEVFLKFAKMFVAKDDIESITDIRKVCESMEAMLKFTVPKFLQSLK